MAKRKRKKVSSRPRPKIPGTSQFASFSSAAGSLPKKSEVAGASASASSAIEGAAVGPSIPAVAVAAYADLLPPLAPQDESSSLKASLPVPTEIARAAVEAVASSPDSQKVEVGVLGQLSPAKPTGTSQALGQLSPAVLPALDKKWSSLLQDPSKLEEMGTPTQHISGVPFVLIPDENIEAAKDEFKEFIFAQFHGNYPEMGHVIGVLNALWARTGPRIYVHNTGPGVFLIRVPNPRTRALLLSQQVWNIAGFPMFVAPWSPEFEPDTPLLLQLR